MKRELSCNWWKYLAVLLLPILVWSTVFFLQNKPERNECLRILYVGSGLDTERLQGDLTSLLPEMKEITVTQEPLQTALGGDWLTSRLFYYDILILPEPCCPGNIGQNFFRRFGDTLSAAFSAVPTYTETADGRELTYALRLAPSETRFSDYCDPEDACLLFFSPESVDPGGENIGTDGNAAVIAARFLTEAIS